MTNEDNHLIINNIPLTVSVIVDQDEINDKLQNEITEIAKKDMSYDEKRNAIIDLVLNYTYNKLLGDVFGGKIYRDGKYTVEVDKYPMRTYDVKARIVDRLSYKKFLTNVGNRVHPDGYDEELEEWADDIVYEGCKVKHNQKKTKKPGNKRSKPVRKGMIDVELLGEAMLANWKALNGIK